ncbi:MAG: hypothetical protein LBC97_11575 [Bifidobacteriaceae bacterium]|nr:hypothetical protein [Bifidobacteriaceae bacterium]
MIRWWIRIVVWVALRGLRAVPERANATLKLFMIRWWIRIVVWVALRGLRAVPGRANATLELFVIHSWIRIVVWVAVGTRRAHPCPGTVERVTGPSGAAAAADAGLDIGLTACLSRALMTAKSHVPPRWRRRTAA